MGLLDHGGVQRALWAGAALCVVLGAGCAVGGAASGAALILGLGLALLGLGCGATHDASERDAAVDAAEAVDAAMDADGYWEPCCEAGEITSCFCPAGVACNYGWFTPCVDGTCVIIGDLCPGDDAGTDAGGDAGGHWEPCCEAGVITTCYCPAETICNYGLFVDCGDGTCTHGDPCPAES